MFTFTPQITVIMPFRNAEKFLDRSICSILKQTFKDFEFIIINDASTDKSNEIILKYLEDKRIIYISNAERLGISRNLNRGIAIAKAPIIARMDGDDISVPERFEIQFAYLTDHPDISIVGTNAILINEEGAEIGAVDFPASKNEVRKFFFFHPPFLHPTVMFRKEDIQKVGSYRSQYDNIEDADLFLRLIFNKLNGANIASNLFYYRKHPNSTDSHFKEKKKLLIKLRREMLSRFNPKEEMVMWLFAYFAFLVDSVINVNQKTKLFHFFKKIIRQKQ